MTQFALVSLHDSAIVGIYADPVDAATDRTSHHIVVTLIAPHGVGDAIAFDDARGEELPWCAGCQCEPVQPGHLCAECAEAKQAAADRTDRAHYECMPWEQANA
jgi:hypothetical protein